MQGPAFTCWESDRTERLQALECDRDALLRNYAEMMPEALDALQPEERHRIFKMLRLRVVAFPDGALAVLREEGQPDCLKVTGYRHQVLGLNRWWSGGRGPLVGFAPGGDPPQKLRPAPPEA
jgi:hypothetical protein